MKVSIKKLLVKVLETIYSTGVLSRDAIRLTVRVETASFNSPEGTGIWYMSGAPTASPTGGSVWGMLLQMRSPFTLHPLTKDAVYTQLFINYNGIAYTRALNNNSWSAWRTL